MENNKEFIEMTLSDIFETQYDIIHTLDGDEDISGFGLTSLMAVQILSAIEEKYGFEISEEDLDLNKLNTINKLCLLISKYLDAEYNDYIHSKSERAKAWDLIGGKFWKIGRKTARPDNSDIEDFLNEIPKGSKCAIVGASTKFLIEKAISLGLKVTVLDFSDVMISELKDELGNFACDYVLFDVLEKVPSNLIASQDFLLSDRLINRFTYDEALTVISNMLKIIKENGEIRNTIKLGFYSMDHRLFEYGKSNGILENFYDSETKTINFKKTASFLGQCINEHGNIPKEILYDWYIGRGKESRFDKEDVVTIFNKAGSLITKETPCSSDAGTYLFIAKKEV